MQTSVRTINLKTIVDTYGVTVVADRAGTSESYIREILRGAKLPSGRERNLGGMIARRIERAFDLQPYWMDILHGKRETNPREMTQDENELLLIYRSLNDVQRRAVLDLVRTLNW